VLEKKVFNMSRRVAFFLACTLAVVASTEVRNPILTDANDIVQDAEHVYERLSITKAKVAAVKTEVIRPKPAAKPAPPKKPTVKPAPPKVVQQAPHSDKVKELLANLQKEIQKQTVQLNQRVQQLSAHQKKNTAEQHDQYLDRLELDDDLDFLSKRKQANLEKVTERLEQLHEERGRPCTGSQCETLRRVVGALRRAKSKLSDADECDAAKDCGSCLKMTACGWCATERACLEGGAVQPRFGPTCGQNWLHSKGVNSVCPAHHAPAGTPPTKFADPVFLFDGECSSFAGSPGDCERAKLRLLAIEHMCLAKGNSEADCERAKSLEAQKIHKEQLAKESERKSTLAALKAQQEAYTKERIARCKEQQGKFSVRFSDCGDAAFGVADSFLELGTGSAATGSTGSTGATGVDEEDKAKEEAQDKADRAAELKEKEENAKTQAEEAKLLKDQARKAKEKADLEAEMAKTGTTGSTGATGVGSTGATGSLGGSATGSVGATSTGASGPELEVEAKSDAEPKVDSPAPTVLGDNIGPDGKPSTEATVSVGMRLVGISERKLREHTVNFTKAIATAWTGSPKFYRNVQLLDIRSGMPVDNGASAPAALDEFIELLGNGTSGVDVPAGPVDVPDSQTSKPSVDLKILITVHGVKALKTAESIANTILNDKAGASFRASLPDSLSSVTVRVDEPKVVSGNTESKKAKAVVQLDAATRNAQLALARHTAQTLRGAMWSHTRPHADGRIQALYVKRFACKDDDCLKKYDDEISAHRRQNSDAVDTEQVEGGSDGLSFLEKASNWLSSFF
jgi:hypothetical protein